jgi:hypothetical protein
MKSLERFQLLANVLIVACSRPNAEVGKLVKAVVTYVTEGTRTDLGDLRLEAYFDLLIQDIDTLRTAAEAKSRKCSESAKCRSARNVSSITVPTRKANIANANVVNKKTSAESVQESPTADMSNVIEVFTESEQSNDCEASDKTEGSCDFNASDPTSSFEQMKECYKKIGDNESQALGVWQQLSESERTAAFVHTQRLQGDLGSRSYLYVYIRDREWTKITSPNR